MKTSSKSLSTIAKIRLFFGLNPCGGKNLLDVDIKFHKDANEHGSHGKIVVTHRGKGLNKAPVSFVFLGLTTPPAINPMVLDYIWEKAYEQGFIPHEILHYGTPLKSHVGLSARQCLSNERRQAEDAAEAERRLKTMSDNIAQNKQMATRAIEKAATNSATV